MIKKVSGLILIVVLSVICLFDFKEVKAEKYLSAYNIQILSSGVGEKNKSLWEIIKGSIIYSIHNVNYYKVVNDNEISDAKIKILLLNVKNEWDFIIKCDVLFDKIKKKLSYKIKSKKDFELFPEKFIKDLKSVLLLTGVIFRIEGLDINVNIGQYYDVKVGDVFFIKDKNNIKGAAIVKKTYDHYSKCVITSLNQEIKKDDIVIPFTYDLNKRFHLFNKYKINKAFKKSYKLNGLYSNKFKVYTSVGKYIYIADEKKAGLFNNEKRSFNKIEDFSYNNIYKMKFDLNERYAAYILKDKTLRVFHFNGLRKFVLKYDIEKNKYMFISEDEKNLYDLSNVEMEDFSYYKKHNLIFYNSKNHEIININLRSSKFNKIVFTNKINKAEKIIVTPNNRKLVIKTAGKIIIKDLQDNSENTIENCEEVKLLRTGIYLTYKNKKNIINYNIYTGIKKVYTFKEPFDEYKFSYSGRYIIYYKADNPNFLNFFDIKKDEHYKDVYNFKKLKYIEKIDVLYNDGLILYGKLSDIDNNKKLDYRDIDSIIYFDFINKKSKVMQKNCNDFLGLSNYKKYFIYQHDKKLFIKDVKHEEIFK